MNEPTEFGSLNDALKRRYGIQGPYGPVGTFASDAFPFVDVSDDGLAPELQWLAGSRLVAQSIFMAADVANQSSLCLDNPAGSGVIAVLERAEVWLASLAVTASVFVNMNAGAPSSTSQGYFRDGRAALTARSSARNGLLAGAFNNTHGLLIFTAANIVQKYDRPVVVTPGRRITFATGGINTRIDANFFWRERRITSGELGE